MLLKVASALIVVIGVLLIMFNKSIEEATYNSSKRMSDSMNRVSSKLNLGFLFPTYSERSRSISRIGTVFIGLIAIVTGLLNLFQ